MKWNAMICKKKKKQKFNNKTDSDSQVIQNSCVISDNDNSISLLFIFQNFFVTYKNI